VESLPNKNMEIKTVGQAIRERYERNTHIGCALSLLSQIINTGLWIDARRVQVDKAEEKVLHDQE
jgi:hypothetical protein